MKLDNATPNGQDPSDERLISLCKQHGDADAFALLYDRYVDRIYRYIYYRIGNHDDVEDLTAAVFVKAWRGLDKYHDRGVPFLAWLYRIARNVVVDHHRSIKAEFVDIETQFSLPSDESTPEEHLLHHSQLEFVLKAMGELDAIQQEVLTLRFIMGMSHKETADILDRKTGAIRVIQHRALHALRTKVTPYE